MSLLNVLEMLGSKGAEYWDDCNLVILFTDFIWLSAKLLL